MRVFEIIHQWGLNGPFWETLTAIVALMVCCCANNTACANCAACDACATCAACWVLILYPAHLSGGRSGRNGNGNTT